LIPHFGFPAPPSIFRYPKFVIDPHILDILVGGSLGSLCLSTPRARKVVVVKTYPLD
jgi:hypothetical protein